MRILHLVILLFFGLQTSIAQETALFDKDGECRAYIDFDQDATIFLVNGVAAAFLEKDGDEIGIIGFNGEFLGWYEYGVLYDEKGDIVGFREGALNISTSAAPTFQVGFAPITPISPIFPFQPYLSSRWSSQSLTEFLYFGKR